MTENQKIDTKEATPELKVKESVSKGGGDKGKGKGDGGGGGGKGDGKGDDKGKKKDDESKGLISDSKQFIKEVIIEFRKITWPDRPQVIKETWSVLFLVTAITLMVLGFDWFLGHAIFGPLEHFAKTHHFLAR